MLKRRRGDAAEEPVARRVLLADTDPDACDLWARVIERADVPVDRCTDGAVLPVLRDTQYGCLVMNCTAPGAGAAGMQLVGTIRQSEEPQIRHVAVILVMPDDRNRLYAWGSRIDGMLVTPVTAERLVAEVVDVLDRPRSQRGPHRSEQLAAARRGDPIH